MNSLNILSSRVISQTPSSATLSPRSSSNKGLVRSASASQNDPLTRQPYYKEDIGEEDTAHGEEFPEDSADELPVPDDDNEKTDEKTPLLQVLQKDNSVYGVRSIAQRFYDAVTEAIKTVLSVFTSSAAYLGRGFRRVDGRYTLTRPLRKLHWNNSLKDAKSQRERNSDSLGSDDRIIRTADDESENPQGSSSPSLDTSEFETDQYQVVPEDANTSHREHSRKSSSASGAADSDDGAPRRSIRIKLQNGPKRNRERKQRERGSGARASGRSDAEISPVANSLKSPMSPSVHKLTKYPHAPRPPRPLVPIRQPSYSWGSKPSHIPQKTLILDLDETLIHSLSKGGRMSSGHMVEVKLSTPIATSTSPGAQPTLICPQHPILYYVHKRPYCDVFLRKICQWYKLVIFTASVQEYADPVIDWLEQERKFFHGRYYRQHCTIRNGAYIKDLSSVEPDLSKVMILDNSPMSYIFHEDNAIPIEGWINDPTDNDLLHLIPILEAMQHATDVRAILTLRRGEGGN